MLRRQSIRVSSPQQPRELVVSRLEHDPENACHGLVRGGTGFRKSSRWDNEQGQDGVLKKRYPAREMQGGTNGDDEAAREQDDDLDTRSGRTGPRPHHAAQAT